MAKKQIKKTVRVKIKKKLWFSVLAPKFFGQKEIGESYLVNAEQAIGRKLKINLRELTGSISDQNIYVRLRISEIEGSNLQTEPIGYSYMPFFLKKLARRNTGKIEDSFVVLTKDKKKTRVKPLIVTAFKINNSMKTLIRKKVKTFLVKEAADSNFETFANNLLRHKVGLELKKSLKKMFPTREAIIREMKLEMKAKKVEEFVEEEKVTELKEEESSSDKE